MNTGVRKALISR